MTTALMIKPFLLTDIDWDNVQYLGSGVSARTYRVAPGIVVRVSGLRMPEMIFRQQYLAEKALALPILDFDLEAKPPQHIRAWECYRHRPGANRETGRCYCDEPLSCILMPEAEFDTEYYRSWDTIFTPSHEAAEFIAHVKQICLDELSYNWDAHYGNIAVWNGEYVAVDFE